MKIDLLDPASFAGGQPHGQFAWLRANAPVYRHPEPGGPGFWAVTRYRDIVEVERDFRRFSNSPTIMIADPDPEFSLDLGERRMMLTMDPPRHTAFRKLIRDAFTDAAAAGMQAGIRGLATRIVNGVIGKGECDFVADVAGEMPSFVIAEMMGLPPEDGRELYKLTEIIHTSPDVLPRDEIVNAVIAMFDYAEGVIREKRARPGSDLASRILQAEVDGERLDDLDFKLFFLLLIDAGGDTTRNLVAGGLLALLEHPETMARLRADISGLLPGAREELLRWCSPVIYMRRTVTEDAEIAGQAVAEGDKVVLYYGAANRDGGHFDRPDRFDIGRSPNDHLAFGTGPHRCLGMHIARVEIDALLAEVLERMHDLELAAEPEWLESNFISGPRRMPVRFRPGPERSCEA
ncbi:MAG: cytochrome P450 [Alphaproteobacteria bacterium]